MSFARSVTLAPVAKRAALALLGLAMLLVAGALWPMIHGAVRWMGLLQGHVAFDAAVVSVPTALVLAAYVGTVTWWWYDRETALVVAAVLVPLYASYVYPIARAYLG